MVAQMAERVGEINNTELLCMPPKLNSWSRLTDIAYRLGIAHLLHISQGSNPCHSTMSLIGSERFPTPLPTVEAPDDSSLNLIEMTLVYWNQAKGQ